MARKNRNTELKDWLGYTQKDVELKKRAPQECGVSYEDLFIDPVEQESPKKRGRPRKPEAPAKPAGKRGGPKGLNDPNYFAEIQAAFRAADTAEIQRIRLLAEQAIRRTFKPGSCYQVRKTKTKYHLASTNRNDCEEGYAFIYEKKEGIHHIFREAKNGWIRTYTDAQLIGKYVDEVQIEDVLIKTKGGYVYA